MEISTILWPITGNLLESIFEREKERWFRDRYAKSYF